ncbi:AGE family epimerase/isomerase [Oricola cellulosilytica]|uniref:AGE family epimerase/isomerase n=1 Tax=Oricola cellulosilytica TaxID=1429082 RepID=A0A4R0P979_9HYPH|nr:AGE family epimerase/isomerase [Oricola cellulosilytica]TCD12302.1 AGE family epimerase/isomerase [Oricola cellulosilytica]
MTDGSSNGRKWAGLAYHRAWLLDQASGLFEFFERDSIDPRGGFHQLDNTGRPILREGSHGGRPAREIHATCRMVHCFAIGRLLGRPGTDRFIDHGMEFIWTSHRDRVNGGYFWGIGDAGPSDPLKQAYGHAFVLLAASSAKVVGHPDADRLLADVSEVLHTRFWEADRGAFAEEFAADWSPISSYRGQNSNMHMTEALMAAHEATGDTSYLEMAESAATLVIRRLAAEQGWRVAEHFDEAWKLDRDYANGDVFRPFGTTPGHSLEWARLLLQLWEMTGRRANWLPEATKALFAQATADSWDSENGGFFYTLDWSGEPSLRNRLWWPCAEGIGAAAFLNAIDGAPEYEIWYRRIWDFVAGKLIDQENGGWRTEPEESRRLSKLFDGKPDLYHALQACLIPLLPTAGTITHGLLNEGLS